MKIKTRWLFGLLALCMLTAFLASLTTAVFFIKGYFRQSLAWQPTQDTARTDQTAGTVNTLETTVRQTTQSSAPAATASPFPTPDTESAAATGTLDPTETTIAATADPSGATGPAESGETSELTAIEQLSLWEYQHQIESIYSTLSASVVGINVEVPATANSSRKTNSGSGLIVREDGIIVTNASLLNIAIDKFGFLANGASIQIVVRDVLNPYTAELIGRDTLTGLAVLRIDPTITALVPAVFSEAPELRVGQMVLSIGFPDVLTAAGGLSTGFITALDHDIYLEDGTSVSMIQTDAQINNKCSGGPLLNLQGQVIGLTNCSIFREISDTMGYALPASVVKQVCTNLADNGFISGRAWLGLTVLQEDSFLALQALYHFPDGLYVSSVIKDSPAYAGDLRKGDIITAINEAVVETHENLVQFLQTQTIGAMVEIEVYRKSDGQYHQLKVYLQEYQR